MLFLGISTINTEVGSGAIIEARSTSIGKIKKLKVKDIGYDLSSDTTVKPDAALPQIIKIDALMSIESVGITSFGRGYVSAPDLLVLMEELDKPVLDADLKYTLGNSKVEILRILKVLVMHLLELLPIGIVMVLELLLLDLILKIMM